MHGRLGDRLAFAGAAQARRGARRRPLSGSALYLQLSDPYTTRHAVDRVACEKKLEYRVHIMLPHSTYSTVPLGADLDPVFGGAKIEPV